jgi:hypothetical protein
LKNIQKKTKKLKNFIKQFLRKNRKFAETEVGLDEANWRKWQVVYTLRRDKTFKNIVREISTRLSQLT